LYGLVKNVKTIKNEPLDCASTLERVVNNWKAKLGVNKLTLTLSKNLQVIENQI
jgi:hypothetical protein